jgi:hypothetical protein
VRERRKKVREQGRKEGRKKERKKGRSTEPSLDNFSELEAFWPSWAPPSIKK